MAAGAISIGEKQHISWGMKSVNKQPDVPRITRINALNNKNFPGLLEPCTLNLLIYLRDQIVNNCSIHCPELDLDFFGCCMRCVPCEANDGERLRW